MVLSKKEMGALIKEARKHKSETTGKKYTQTMLAADLNLSRGYIGDLENGRIYPSYVLLHRISNECEVPFGFFDDEANCESTKPYEKSIVEVEVKEPAEIRDVKKAMGLIMSQPGLMLNGEMLSDESKIALANAITMGLVYAEQMQKNEKLKPKDK